jgi:acetylornithine deacetylase/succinyl-diaminopimelate desuccinylase-like protein
MTAPIDAVLAQVDAQLPQALERLFALMRIPSVSTEAAHVGDCRRAADFMKDELIGIGFDARLVESAVGGHPFVVGHHEGPADAPHILFYGHYDVQPVDPIALWNSPPFEPAIETRADGSQLIRGRGSSDDKAQLKTFVEACRAWKTVTGVLPCRVTVFLEGEEESGSQSMPAFLRDHGHELKADAALICDTNMWNGATPAITTSLRGMASGDLVIHGPSRDLHSGLYGGAAANPLSVLVKILAELKDETGRVTLQGFYDGVPETPEAAKAMWAGLGFSSDDFLGGVGLSAPAGERGRSTLELLWARPTAEINGVIGGYTGDGFKTVIPAQALAKISFRLVGDQDPVKVWAAFEAHVKARLPADCTATFLQRQGNPAVSLPLDSPAVTACAAALAQEWNVPTPLIGGGGSIPIAGDFARELGMAPVLVGFALDDDNIHSPNEKYELNSFHRGARSWARILAELARSLPAA